LEITCNGCKSRFVIPDKKLPKGKIVKIKCPKCGEKITLSLDKSNEKITLNDLNETHEEFSDIDNFSYSDDELSETYEGKKLAFFVGDDTGLLSRISKPIEEMEYKIISASEIKTAIGKMRLNHFDLILIQDGFGGNIQENLVIKYLNRLSMSIRRKSFVVLLSKIYKTMDQMMAFALSVNLIINLNDLDKLKDIINKSIKRQELFYKPFLDIMKEIGKI